jgi:hypothetical protein
MLHIQLVFYAHWYIFRQIAIFLWSFGTGFPNFGMLRQQKSGNPEGRCDTKNQVKFCSNAACSLQIVKPIPLQSPVTI